MPQELELNLVGTLFTCDVFKAEANMTRHGVAFAAIYDALVLTVGDDRHPVSERRSFSLGETRSGRLLTVGHTDEDDVVRTITARPATGSERRSYESG